MIAACVQYNKQTLFFTSSTRRELFLFICRSSRRSGFYFFSLSLSLFLCHCFLLDYFLLSIFIQTINLYYKSNPRYICASHNDFLISLATIQKSKKRNKRIYFNDRYLGCFCLFFFFEQIFK
jgi:hypothetical protein